MKIVVLIFALILLVSIPIVYSLTIYQPDNCERLTKTLSTQYESEKDINAQITFKGTKLISDNSDFIAFETSSTNTPYYSCNCIPTEDLLFLKGLRGFSLKHVTLNPGIHSLTLLVFKDAKGKEMGSVSIERINKYPDEPLKTVTNSNKVQISLPLSRTMYNVVGIGAPGFNGAKHIMDLLHKATNSIAQGKTEFLTEGAKKFIADLHVEEMKKQPTTDDMNNYKVKIRVAINNFIHEAAGILNNANMIDISCVWDSQHGVIWAPQENQIKNTIQTLNTANEDVFPIIVSPKQPLLCEFITRMCTVPVEKIYQTTMNKCISQY
jgi:hypothetical protein